MSSIVKNVSWLVKVYSTIPEKFFSECPMMLIIIKFYGVNLVLHEVGRYIKTNVKFFNMIFNYIYFALIYIYRMFDS